jgi:hypothetical protein
MKRISQCSVDHWAVERLSFRDPNVRRQRVRMRRFPLPRQTRGLDLDVVISFGSIEGAPTQAVASPTAPEVEGSKSVRLVRPLLWICVIILGLILFGDWIVRFIREAPLAWPSLNGRF